ncbi:VTC domain-containing protein [Bacteroidia bacterium]|nr:VTC domain-containing protein [Bacteroidia bacterium]
MNIPINDILNTLSPISLDEMKGIRLMDRIDTKYVAPVSVLPQLLAELTPYFRVQVVDDAPIASYCTQYLDTPDLAMFTMHQNGKLKRQKIRIRSYIESHLSFLEIKNKNNKGRTKKVRIPVAHTHVDSMAELSGEQTFLDENSVFNPQDLCPALANNFKRITLVNNKKTERVTIDIDLSFQNCLSGVAKDLCDVMIIELKQDGWQRSDFRDILMQLHIKPMSFSKYCIGTVLTNPNVKYNRFKRRAHLLDKLITNS